MYAAHMFIFTAVLTHTCCEFSETTSNVGWTFHDFGR